MKPRLANASRMTQAALILLSAVMLISWKQHDGNRQQQQQNQNRDTIPQSRERKVRDLDEAIEELDRIDLKAYIDQAMASASEAMKQIDANKLQLEIKKAMDQVNMEQVKADIDKAMKNIDFEKIQAEVKASMDQIDWKELKAEIENAKNVNYEEVNRELAKAQEEIKKIQPQLEKELAKAREELKNIQPQIEKELANAKVEIEKAKNEIREYKSFVDGLEQDGLLNKKEDYTIQHKDGRLTVNGKEVPSTIYNKYKSFLDKHKKLHIKKEDNSFDMDNDNED